MKPLGLLPTQRNSRAVDPHLQRISAERTPEEGELGPLDEAEHHQSLYGRIGGFDGLDTSAIAGIEIRECQDVAPRPAAQIGMVIILY